MKRFKMALLALAVLGTGVVLQFGNCARFLGDLVGDRFWLSAID